jgi:hypothetical protein
METQETEDTAVSQTYETLTKDDFEKLRELVVEYNEELYRFASDTALKDTIRNIFKSEVGKTQKLLVRLINSIPREE